METTTGMSAPPIGTISSTPRTRDKKQMIQKAVRACPPDAVRKITKTAMATPMARLSQCWPLKTMGALRIRPCSFMKAMTEPEKVIAPMAAPMDSSISEAVPNA